MAVSYLHKVTEGAIECDSQKLSSIPLIEFFPCSFKVQMKGLSG